MRACADRTHTLTHRFQDKIKRLESERSAATDECGRLRRQLESVAKEVEAQRRVEASAAEDKQSAARLAYERLLADKSAVDSRLNRAGALEAWGCGDDAGRDGVE
jgi:predicted RNase H-like nuclease (RuvC/YqgF family)